MATAHKKFNNIDRLIIRGDEVKEPEVIKVNMIEFYKKLYIETELWRPSFEYVNYPRISQEEQDSLQRPFSEDEVLNIIKQCDGDKAPGPDGFTMSFFKVCWEILKEDLMQTIHNFHQKETFEKSFNATFVALIPKNMEQKS
ncbi:hypothetical protein H5410_009876 [Solanum commersonii]|uniref:Uncharacterized protein n=1 Tax=Solanum commersonii TaxID=4109 RepID=A0A9J6AKR3_SOLCO|nr:hypothetical protein H5410_009876 [Solanum commersonii]